jgi:hypothetical protein
MYFIKSGQIEICGDNGIVFVTLSTGSFFGEIALFEACKRTASARAKGDVELCTLKKEDFNLIMDGYPDVAIKIRESIRERKKQERRVKGQKSAEDAKVSVAAEVERLQKERERDRDREQEKEMADEKKWAMNKSLKGSEFFLGRMSFMSLSATGSATRNPSVPASDMYANMDSQGDAPGSAGCKSKATKKEAQ